MSVRNRIVSLFKKKPPAIDWDAFNALAKANFIARQHGMQITQQPDGWFRVNTIKNEQAAYYTARLEDAVRSVRYGKR